MYPQGNIFNYASAETDMLALVLQGATGQALERIRSMIERIDLHSREGGRGLDAILHGDLAAILAASAGAQTANVPDLAASGRHF